MTVDRRKISGPNTQLPTLFPEGNQEPPVKALKAAEASLPDAQRLSALKGPSQFGNPFKFFGNLKVDLSEVAPDKNIAVTGSDWAFQVLENPRFPGDADKLLTILRDRNIPA